MAQMTSIDRGFQYFSNIPLNRANNQRYDQQFLASCLDHPNAQCIIFDAKCFPLIKSTKLANSTKTEVSWNNLQKMKLDPRIIPFHTKFSFSYDSLILLGTSDNDDVPHFALRINEDNALNYTEDNVEHVHTNLRSVPLLSIDEVAILGQAQALINWHTNHRFCSNCGHVSVPAGGGSHSVCPKENGGCGTEHYPRNDPVAIMLIHSGNKCLLGRQKVWDKGRYSTLAGFMEAGESLEDAVRREVAEESGVIVGKVEYRSSQYYPFPNSLMLGCLGEAIQDKITVDTKELEDAQWFERSEVVKALNGEPDAKFSLPAPFAISHQLIKYWALSTSRHNNPF